MILHQMIVQGRRRVSYRKERREINKRILDWIRNPILDSVWIKDLSMLYYSILDDELI